MTIQQGLPTLSDPQLLDMIDTLRGLNIGQHDIGLPQLVVVGDQSSGKSSLLESLTGIPFPRDQSLCTRHATQITSRRADKESVKITIIPGPRASDEHRKQVESFRSADCNIVEFRANFTEIMKKAHDKMGLRSDLSSTNGHTFSQDVLKVEVYGKHEDHLTIIDVPGIFRTTGEGTTKDDMDMVRSLVQNYIKDDRTIILAVLPSNVDIATQEILQLSEDYDVHGERTIGVLTKPDLVTEQSAQAAVCELIQGKRRPLNLGYYLVRNRGADGEGSEHFDPESLFKRSPWNQLPEDRVGILALKTQLRMLLDEVSRREFPRLVAELRRKVKECNDELDSLGPSRNREREQRMFLSHIAGQFQDTTRAALAADYNSHAVFEKDELRLITQVVNIMDVFSTEFRRSAHSRIFDRAEPASPMSCPDEALDEHQVRRAEHSLPDQLKQEMFISANLHELRDREIADLGALDLVNRMESLTLPSGNVSEWIRAVYHRSRGMDLGTFNTHLVSTAFTEQSRKWEPLTKLYLSRVIVTIHRFIDAVLSSLCPDAGTCQNIWEEIRDGVVDGYKRALEQTDLLIQVNQKKKPWTFNAQFTQILAKDRAERLASRLRPQARIDTKQYGEIQHMVNLDSIPQAIENQSNTEHLQEEIHDILHAYYSVALDRYIDNVFQLSVDYHLLNGPESPLKVFTQDWVLGLDQKKLQKIAAESKSVRNHRTRVMNKLSDMEKALAVLKQ